MDKDKRKSLPRRSEQKMKGQEKGKRRNKKSVGTCERKGEGKERQEDEDEGKGGDGAGPWDGGAGGVSGGQQLLLSSAAKEGKHISLPGDSTQIFSGQNP